MFSTFASGRRYPGSISHRHKHVTFGKIAIGIAKGTAMIVIGVPVCTIAAGIGATAIVAYGLASPFYYGGKKLVKKIRRQVKKKEELACTDHLTREDILVWLENCDGDPDSSHADAASADGSGANASSASATAAGASASAAGSGQQRKKPTLRRLFSRESRGFRLIGAASAMGSAVDGGAASADVQQSRSDYRPLVNEPEEETEQEELWKEMEHVVRRLRQDRLSICPENVVAIDKPLILESSRDVMQFIRTLQLEGHLCQLTRATSLPILSPTAGGPMPPEEDLLASLPQSTLSVQKRYLRTVSDNGGLACHSAAVE